MKKRHPCYEVFFGLLIVFFKTHSYPGFPNRFLKICLKKTKLASLPIRRALARRSLFLFHIINLFLSFFPEWITFFFFLVARKGHLVGIKKIVISLLERRWLERRRRRRRRGGEGHEICSLPTFVLTLVIGPLSPLSSSSHIHLELLSLFSFPVVIRRQALSSSHA